MKLRVSILCLVSLLFFTACEKELMQEESVVSDVDEETDVDSKLTILTRAAAGEEISYPVTVFVMDGDGNCIKKETLADADAAFSVKLPAATYQVYGIAGATEEDYTIPSAFDASANYELALKQGTVHGDLMTAQNTVTLGSSESNVLTLGFTRKVLNVKTITINQVPEDVTAVSVTLTPLYKSICLNGNYVAGTGDAQTATVSLTRQEDGTTWKNASECYLLPAVSAATITVKMTLNGIIISSSYSYSQTLQANSDLNITGTYTGNAGEFTMSGVFTGAVWGTPTNINFTFNESGAQDAGSTQGGGGSTTGSGDAPAKYTWYKNCMVISSEDNGDQIVVTLIHRDEVEISTEGKTAAEVETAINAALPNFTIEGITGWRLPTSAEVGEIPTGVLNSEVEDHGGKAYHPGGYYFYKDGDELGSFIANNPQFPYSVGQYLRPVTTLSFPKQ